MLVRVRVSAKVRVRVSTRDDVFVRVRISLVMQLGAPSACRVPAVCQGQGYVGSGSEFGLCMEGMKYSLRLPKSGMSYI